VNYLFGTTFTTHFHLPPVASTKEGDTSHRPLAHEHASHRCSKVTSIRTVLGCEYVGTKRVGGTLFSKCRAASQDLLLERVSHDRAEGSILCGSSVVEVRSPAG
jgi:hypothetical protein